MQALRSDLNIPTHLFELFNPPCSIRNVSVFRSEPQDAGAQLVPTQKTLLGRVENYIMEGVV